MMTLSPGPSCTSGAFNPGFSRVSCPLGLAGGLVGGAAAATAIPFSTSATTGSQVRMLRVPRDHIEYITASYLLSRRPGPNCSARELWNEESITVVSTVYVSG